MFTVFLMIIWWLAAAIIFVYLVTDILDAICCRTVYWDLIISDLIFFIIVAFAATIATISVCTGADL